MSRGIKLRITLNRALIDSAARAGGKEGLFAALDHLASVSKDQVPLDQGPLKNSCEIDVADDGSSGTVSYDTPYAVVQHEDTGMAHQRGRKAKYLEDPLNDPGVQSEMVKLLGGGLGSRMGG